MTKAVNPNLGSSATCLFIGEATNKYSWETQNKDLLCTFSWTFKRTTGNVYTTLLSPTSFINLMLTLLFCSLTVHHSFLNHHTEADSFNVTFWYIKSSKILKDWLTATFWQQTCLFLALKRVQEKLPFKTFKAPANMRVLTAPTSSYLNPLPNGTCQDPEKLLSECPVFWGFLPKNSF